MITKRLIIIGLPLLIWTLSSAPAANANYCDGKKVTHYQKIYCDIEYKGNKDADQKVIETVAKQHDYDERIVQGILDKNLCEATKDISVNKLPDCVQTVCTRGQFPSQNEKLACWTNLNKVKTSYDREKAMYLNKKSLTFAFESSEMYWNGKLTDGPFDLIVDLNLIEQMLFGSRADWTNDVFKFPKKQDEKGGSSDDGEIDPNNELRDREVDGTEDEDAQAEDETDESDAPADCVPPDDPRADLGSGPGSNVNNLLCGNGVIDDLMGEACDDGNKESGDGCSQYCQTESAGGSLICQDPEAVTFRNPNDGNPSGTGDGDGNNNEDGCPAGLVPIKVDTDRQERDDDLFEQYPGYPGPSIGGVLKQFPPSNRPICPPDSNPVPWIQTSGSQAVSTISVAGNQNYLMKDGEPVCIPTEWCVDPDVARDFLIQSIAPGTDWRSLDEDNDIRQAIEAIEAVVCVNISKENRPVTPYQKNEGCVDCHIVAMVDALEEALETNVSPLENTMSAFGYSSKFGPKFSFNLSTSVKAKLKIAETNTIEKAVEKAREAAAERREALEVDNPTISSPFLGTQQMEYLIKQHKERLNQVLEETEIYKTSNAVISDQEISTRITPLIIQMHQSFRNIQDKYVALLNVLELDSKDICQP
jgi:cysteine-rich repeat protein